MNSHVLDIESESVLPQKSMWKSTSLFHLLGASLIATAWISFMLSSWLSWSHLGRFYASSGLCVLLLVTAVQIAKRMREGGGARIIFMMSLLGVPVLFSQAGAFLLFYVGKAGQTYPSFLHWKAHNLFDLLQVLTVTSVVGVATSFLAYPLLLRGRVESHYLACLYLVMNAVLLIPIRSITGISLLLVAALALLIYSFVNIYRKKAVPDSTTERAALTILSLPILVLGGRSLFLYHTGVIHFGLLTMGIGALLFFVASLRQTASNLCQWFGISMIAIGVPYFMFGVAELTHNRVFSESIPFVLSVLGLLLSRRVIAHGHILSTLSLLVLAGEYLRYFFTVSGYSTFLVFTIAIVWALEGLSKRERIVTSLGIVLFIFAIFKQLYSVIFIAATAAPWASLALIGIIFVITGSLIERYGSLWRAKLARVSDYFEK